MPNDYTGFDVILISESNISATYYITPNYHKTKYFSDIVDLVILDTYNIVYNILDIGKSHIIEYKRPTFYGHSLQIYTTSSAINSAQILIADDKIGVFVATKLNTKLSTGTRIIQFEDYTADKLQDILIELYTHA